MPRTPTTYSYPKSEFTTSLGVVNTPNLKKTVAETPNIPVVLEDVIYGDDEIAHFVFRDSLSAEAKESLDSIVANHDGTPLPAGNVDVHGNPVVAPTFLHATEQARLKGYTLTCGPETVHILDVEVTTQLYVQGGQFWLANARQGDKASFSIVDKNNVLGLHTQMGVPLGDPIELVKYIDGYEFPTADVWRDEIIMPTVAPVAPGLFLRVTLETTADGDQRTLHSLYRWYVG